MLKLEEMTVGNKRYKLTHYEDDTSSLLRFNDKYNMWVKVNFSNKMNNEIDEITQDTLCRSFLNRKSMLLS